MDLDTLPAWAEPVADPFRRDPAFWRAVFACADAAVLLVLAGAASALLTRAGTGMLPALAPFAAPLGFSVWAAVSGYRSSRASRVWFRHRGQDGLASWRDSERRAVASVFLHALVRNRLTVP